jgi:hypothetical protein
VLFRSFKLGEDPVHRGQTDVGIVIEQVLENILGSHVPLYPFLKDFQNLLTRDGGFQPGAFEFVHVFSVANE